jgi:hypothetical protein
MNLEMEKKNVNFNIIQMFFLKNHLIWTAKMDFHSPFLGEWNVHLPNIGVISKWNTLICLLGVVGHGIGFHLD